MKQTPVLAAAVCCRGSPLTPLPNRGTLQSTADPAAGRVQLQVDIRGAGEGFVRRGRLRAMAASGFERAPSAADVPTAREQGMDLGLTGWQALVAPAGVPRPNVGRLNAEIRRALANAEVARRIRTQGDERAHSSPEELHDLIAAVSKRVGRVVRDTGITVD